MLSGGSSSAPSLRTEQPICPQIGLVICPQTGLATCPQTGLAICAQTGLVSCPQTRLVICPQTGLAIFPQTGLVILNIENLENEGNVSPNRCIHKFPNSIPDELLLA